MLLIYVGDGNLSLDIKEKISDISQQCNYIVKVIKENNSQLKIFSTTQISFKN